MVSLLLACGLLLMSSAHAAVVVRMEEAVGIFAGNIDVWLRDDIPWDTTKPDSTPIVNPVDNFLVYVNAGAYDYSIIHRAFTGTVSVVQGGSYTWDKTNLAFVSITTGSPIYYQSKMANANGTLAMARTQDPNSATSGWFFNTTDNSTAYAGQPSCDPTATFVYNPDPFFQDPCGYTAFGTVLSGMNLVYLINSLPVYNLSPEFPSIPLYNAAGLLQTDNLVFINTVRVIASAASSVQPVQGPSGEYTIISPDSPAVSVSEFKHVASPPTSTIDFSEGSFSIKLANVPAVPVAVTMTLPLQHGPASNRTPGLIPNTFYKYGPTPDNPVAHWYNFMWDGQTGAVMTAEGNVLKLIFVDGQRGDDDLTEDGNITAGTVTPGKDPSIGPSVSTMGVSGNYSTLSLLSSSDVVTKFEAAANPSPGDAPAGVTFGEGFFDIGLSTTQTTSNVVLTLPKDQQPNTYYKYGPTPDNLTPHWYEFMWDGKTGAIMGVGPNKNLVALVFVDGERGDDDLADPGIITDVGAPGVKIVSSAGGGGGGAVDVWSLLALLGLSGWFTAQRRRH
jgi:cyclophilin family peptidyl-prolyl cis-trans isomerase